MMTTPADYQKPSTDTCTAAHSHADDTRRMAIRLVTDAEAIVACDQVEKALDKLPPSHGRTKAHAGMVEARPVTRGETELLRLVDRFTDEDGHASIQIVRYRSTVEWKATVGYVFEGLHRDRTEALRLAVVQMAQAWLRDHDLPPPEVSREAGFSAEAVQ